MKLLLFSWEKWQPRWEELSTALSHSLLEMPQAFIMIMRGGLWKRNSKACGGSVRTGARSTFLNGASKRVWLDHVTRWKYQAWCIRVSPLISQEPLAMWRGEGRPCGATERAGYIHRTAEVFSEGFWFWEALHSATCRLLFGKRFLSCISCIN